jgi:hypothetical protein
LENNLDSNKLADATETVNDEEEEEEEEMVEVVLMFFPDDELLTSRPPPPPPPPRMNASWRDSAIDKVFEAFMATLDDNKSSLAAFSVAERIRVLIVEEEADCNTSAYPEGGFSSDIHSSRDIRPPPAGVVIVDEEDDTLKDSSSSSALLPPPPPPPLTTFFSSLCF